MSLTLVEEQMVAIYFNTSATETPSWTRYTRAEGLTISNNPEIEERKFIAYKNKSRILKNYDYQIDSELTMYVGDPLFDSWWTKYKARGTGADANIEMLICWDFDATAGSSKAWEMTNALLVFNEMNCTDSKLSVNVYLGDTIIDGTVTRGEDGTPTFTATVI